ncbi:hypothetical protein IW262DRAFT_1312505 [Armillaria fumosa]|nr:hypothetical protein IW262DRAFT_1312505 [Armillaria fumosa]
MPSRSSFYSTTTALLFSAFLAIGLSAWIRKTWSRRPPQGTSTPSFKGNGKHTPRPHFIAFSVPYLCRSAPYDYNPRGFWDFPERKGWMLDGKGEHRKFPNEIIWDLHDLDSQYACRQRSIPEEMLSRRPQDSLTLKCYRIDGSVSTPAEEVAFLQAWLFFGVIAEVSSICGLCGSSVETRCVNFVQDPLSMVSTSVLNDFVTEWLASLDACNAKEQADRIACMLNVVKHVMSLQTIISTYGDPKKVETRTLAYSECKVLLSIRLALRAVLLTLLKSRRCDMSEIRFLMNPQIQQSFPAKWDELKDFASKELLASGWCRSECKLLERMDGSYNFFATCIPRWPMDHSRCNDFMCLADQINEDHYVQAHVGPQCHCESVVLDPEKLRSILEKGKVPRVFIEDDDELTVSEDHHYVAISHVWSHGLGNPSENSLPLCQIRRLRKHTSSLQGSKACRPAVWIDTLCIPVAKHLRAYRKKAIELMGNTYRHADAVLVLDRELQHIDTQQVSPLESDIVMAFVGWTRRLWTLQEAALAQKLHVQVLDRPEPIQPALDETEMLVSQVCCREDIGELIRDRIPPLSVLRKSTEVETNDFGGGFSIVVTRTALQSLSFAVKHRSTSKMEDEAVILAITLGMDVKDLVDIPDVDGRMAKFLQMTRDVPSDIVFGDWERIGRAPYRWAPRSLLNFPIFRLESFGPPGTCDSEGLHATYKGFIFYSAACRRPVGSKYFAIDRASEIKYEFDVLGATSEVQLPERPALIFRPQDINGDVAIVDMDQTNVARDSSEPLVVHVVGYLQLVASGSLSDIKPGDMLEGTMTSNTQAWIIT